MQNKNWTISTPPAFPQLEDWSKSLDLAPRLLEILYNRGLTEYNELELFLYPHLRNLAPIKDWPQLMEAAETLVTGLLNNKKMTVYGDYDVDGITSCITVLEVIKHHGFACNYYLPKRSEGYGLNTTAIKKLAEQGCKLLLTVDCGISDVEQVELARSLGMDVVISDHHLPPAILPNANAICNPRLGKSPCNYLAGVGVAFFLMAAVNSLLEKHSGVKLDMRHVLDMVALGTLADVVPVTGQNRILVKNGLLKITQATRPGLAELKAICGYNPAAALGAGQVVFSLAPRINAVGRLECAEKALELLLAPSNDLAAPLAKELDQANTTRRGEEDRILNQALEQAGNYLEYPAMVLYGEDWHQGIIGIVASRLIETFYRPVLILCKDKEQIKGSGRSIPEYNLYEGLFACREILLNFGGHKQAAGLRLEADKLEALRLAFNKAVADKLGHIPLRPSLKLDGELDFALASDFNFLKSLSALQPYGTGNPEPLFSSPPLILRQAKAFGPKRQHLNLELMDTTTNISLQAKLWRQSEIYRNFTPGQKMQLAYTPTLNNYNGVSSVELKIKDFKIL